MQMPEPLFEPVAERLRVLADANRLRILNVLREAESSVDRIVGKVGTSQPNVSRHLALLLRAGIVTRRQEGRQVRYRVVDPFVDQICEAICGSLRAHVDRQAERLPEVRANGGGRRAAMVISSRGTTTSPRATTRRRRT
jgi:DNA-binding transcriptional ArsR family regulator